MKNFGIALFVGGAFGGLASLALFPTLSGSQRELEVGGFKLPVELADKFYTNDQVMIAVFLASSLGALLAALVMFGLMPKKRRRRS